MALSAADLAAMRSEVALHYPDTCKVRRYTSVPTGGGGQTDTYADSSTVACRIETPSVGSEGERAGRITAEEGIVIKVPYSTDVTEKDQVQVTTGQWAATYEVASVDVRSSEIERVLHVEKVS